jgi:hypothetical protein
MAETVKRNRDSLCYKNYDDKHDTYEYQVSIQKEFYMKNEYEIERGVISMMFEDQLLNARVYNQLHDDINRKQNAVHFKRTLHVAFVFYLLLLAYSYMTSH